VNLKILLFNNRIYGLTKGQYSPTSEHGQDHQVHPPGLPRLRRSTRCRWRWAPRPRSWRAPSTRTASTSPRCCARLPPTAGHRTGRDLPELPIFNDGAFEGQPLRTADRVVIAGPQGLELVPTDEAPEDHILVHDPRNPDPSRAFTLAWMDPGDMSHVPVGIFRDVPRPAYDDQVRGQVNEAMAAAGHLTDEDVNNLFAGRDPWVVEEEDDD
jgi:2-oxoglutarate ferredoxin oxidoreductase subunit beta